VVELVLLADEPVVEALTDELIHALQALSAAVEDADAAGPHEQALFGEPGLPAPRTAWQRSRVVALFAVPCERSSGWNELRHQA